MFTDLRFKNSFDKARVILSVWYSLILALILAAFSVFLYFAQVKDFQRVVLQREFGNRIPRILTQADIQDIRTQIEELKYRFMLNLLVIDGAIVLIGAFLSYFLAGKTLQPIEKSLQQQKDFLSDASHELRTPVTAILTASEVALRTSSKTKEEYRKVLEQAFRESKRMCKIIENLMTLTRADRNGWELNRVRLSLMKLLEEVVEELDIFAEKKSMKVVIQKDKDATVLADYDTLKQLFLILLDNAIKYSPEKGKVILQITHKPHLRVKVKDQGIGMTEDEQAHIFERFYRGDKSRSTEGYGLGLSIAETIAKAHALSLTVESKLGKGSTFTVTF